MRYQMAGALLYLRLTSLQGLLRARLSRLKQPKYLFGALVGAAYLYFFFFRRLNGGGGYGPPRAVPPEILPMLASFGALAVLTIVALAWLLPRAPAALAFTEAEIAFLFPAPVGRRTLIHFRLLSTFVRLAFTAALLALVSNRSSSLGGNAATHAIGWWIILVTISLHLTGSSFAISRLRDRGLGTLQRGALVGGMLAVLAVWVWRNWQGAQAFVPRDGSGIGGLGQYVSAHLASQPLSWLLAIPRWIVAPFFRSDLRQFALALGPAVLIVAAHYVWVLTSEARFEEASIERAAKRAQRLAAIKSGNWQAANQRKKRSEPFVLAAQGRPELAFLWKNLLATSLIFRPRVGLVVAAIIAAACTWLAAHPVYRTAQAIIASAAAFLFMFTLLLGPQMARQDLRSDLPNADILKSYPLRGWQIVLGELLAPLAILVAIMWLVLLVLALSGPIRNMGWLPLEGRAVIAVGVAMLVVPFCAIQLLVQNTVAVVFPAWVQQVANRGDRGLDMMGQRIVFMAGQLLVAAMALLPAAILAAIVVFSLRPFVGTVAAAVAALIAVLAILVIETWLGLLWLGKRFESFDLSSELRP